MGRKVFIGKKEKSQINTGGGSVGTTAAQLSTNGRDLKTGVTIVADAGNADVVYVGVRSNLTSNGSATDGFPLSAGEAFTFPVASESELYVLGGAAAQGYHFASF